jgi:hypothetical protein
MKTTVVDSVQDPNELENELVRDMEDEEDEEDEVVQVKTQRTKKNKTSAVAGGGISKPKKKHTEPRALPRPYKNIAMVKLTANIDTLRERVEVTDNRIQTYSIRLRKLNSELEMRKNE